MKQEFGPNWETIFVGLSESSLIGSGAIAQVSAVIYNPV